MRKVSASTLREIRDGKTLKRRLIYLLSALLCWMPVSFGMAEEPSDAERPQRFMLLMKAGTIDSDLSPWISKFGNPDEVQTKLLTSLDIVLVQIPASWQRLDADAFCRHLVRSPAVIECTADVALQALSAPSDLGGLRVKLAGFHECRPWYLGAGNCPDPPSPVNIRAGEAWTYSTGSDDVVVAVLDSGIDFDEPNIRDNVWQNTTEIQGRDGVDDDGNGYIDDKHGWNVVDFANTNNDVSISSCSPGLSHISSHGTKVAQIIASSNQGRNVSGVAWQTRLMILRTTNCRGEGNIFAVTDAINYVLKAVEKGINVRVINHSNRIPLVYSRITRSRLLDELASAGIIWVNGAGNDHTHTEINRVTTRTNTIYVGGVTKEGESIYVTHPKHVDLAAPALGLPVLEGPLHLHRYNHHFAEWQKREVEKTRGTSVAGPQVAGALALLYAYRPKLKHQQARTALLKGVRVRDNLRGLNATSGVLDVAGMFEQLPGLAVDFPNNKRQIIEGSTIRVTVRLTHLAAQPSSRSIAVPISLRVEDNTGLPDVAFISPARLTLSADQSSLSFTIHAAKDNFVDDRREILLSMQADDNLPSEYAGAARSIPLPVVNSEYQIHLSSYYNRPQQYSVYDEGFTNYPHLLGLVQRHISDRSDHRNILQEADELTHEDTTGSIFLHPFIRYSSLDEMPEKVKMGWIRLMKMEHFFTEEGRAQTINAIETGGEGWTEEQQKILISWTRGITIPYRQSFYISIAPSPRTTVTGYLQIDPPDYEDDLAVSTFINRLTPSHNPTRFDLGPYPPNLGHRHYARLGVKAIGDNRPERERRYTVTFALQDEFPGERGIQYTPIPVTWGLVTVPVSDTPTLGFDQAHALVQEGMESAIRIIARPAPSEAVTVTLSFHAGGNLHKSDLELPVQILFAEGQTSAVVTIKAKNDQAMEQHEAGTLRMTVQGFAESIRRPLSGRP